MSRIAFQAPVVYDPAKFNLLVLAINQRLDEATGGSSSADTTVTRDPVTLVEPRHNFPIGRGAWFEFVATNSFGSLTGLSGGSQGRMIVIYNSDQSNADVVLFHNSSSSSEDNRFITRDGSNYTIQAGEAALVMYSGEKRGWVPVAEVP